jgi:tetratricopeptide (TPR) repeat protein
MARRPKKKSKRNKQSTARQRLQAQPKRAAAKETARPALPRHKPDVRIDKAQNAWQARRYDEAIWYYERALARDPNNAVLLVDVARAYGLRFRFADAGKLVDRACALHPNDAHLQLMLGRSYVMLKQFDRGIDCYLRALDLNPESAEKPQVLLELAKMHERLHDLDRARQCAEEALELAPWFEPACYQLAILERRRDDLEAAQARLRELIQRGRAAPGVIGDSWYQLASIYDKTGRFEEAYDALVGAKQIFDRGAAATRYDAMTISKTCARTMRTITPDHFQRWHADGAQWKISGKGMALLTSHPRSGTTLLEQVLDSHSELISADELQVMAELVYLPLCQDSSPQTPVPDILDRAGHDDLHKLKNDYWSAMEGALGEPIGDRILLDKNPALTKLLPIVARVFPEMKILFALRDPRDVVVSCFSQQLPLNPVSVHYLTLEETAKEYAKTMCLWLKLRDMIRNPWIELRYEDTVFDLENQARKVLDFLQLPWDDRVLDYHRRAQLKHVHSPTYEAVTKPVYTSSIGRWRNYARQLEPCMETLRPYIDAFGYENVAETPRAD